MPNDWEQGTEVDRADQWNWLASELRARKESQRRTWGELDDTTLGRYLAGESSSEERSRVERELQARPELRKLTELVRDVLSELGPLEFETDPAVAEAPRLLSFAQAKQKKTWGQRLRSRSSLVAAACLVLLLGMAMPRGNWLRSPHFSADVAAPFAIARLDEPAFERNAGLAHLPPGAVRQASEAIAASPALPAVGALALPAEPQDDLLDQEIIFTSLESVKKSYLDHKSKFGPNHPSTRALACNLADVYVAGLNGSPVAMKRPPEPLVRTETAPGVLATTDSKPVRAGPPRSLSGPSQSRYPYRLGYQSTRQINRDVVPILMTALQHATDSEKRLTYVQALGRLGPAGRAAVPVLKQRLEDSTDANEVTAVLLALKQMGEAAYPARPVLESLTRLDGKKPGITSSQRALALQIVQYLQSSEGRVGICDEEGCFTLETLQQSCLQLTQLARKSGLEVYLETGPLDRVNPEKHLKRMGERALYLAVDMRTPAVRIELSEQLKKESFNVEALRKHVLDACRQGNLDQGLLAGMKALEDSTKPGK